MNRGILAAAIAAVAIASPAGAATDLADPAALVLADSRASAAAKNLVRDPGPGGGTVTEALIRRDVTGDRVPDLVVPVYSGGSGGIFHYFVYSVVDGEVRNILARNNLYQAGVSVSSGRLIQKLPYYDANDANCCPSRVEIAIFRWNGARLVVAKRGTRILK
jgi:hypothetical protein